MVSLFSVIMSFMLPPSNPTRPFDSAQPQTSLSCPYPYPSTLEGGCWVPRGRRWGLGETKGRGEKQIIQIPASYFVDIAKLILKFLWKGNRPATANTMKKKKAGGLTLPDVKTDYQTTVTKTVWYW